MGNCSTRPTEAPVSAGKLSRALSIHETDELGNLKDRPKRRRSREVERRKGERLGTLLYSTVVVSTLRFHTFMEEMTVLKNYEGKGFEKLRNMMNEERYSNNKEIGIAIGHLTERPPLVDHLAAHPYFYEKIDGPAPLACTLKLEVRDYPDRLETKEDEKISYRYDEVVEKFGKVRPKDLNGIIEKMKPRELLFVAKKLALYPVNHVASTKVKTALKEIADKAEAYRSSMLQQYTMAQVESAETKRFALEKLVKKYPRSILARGRGFTSQMPQLLKALEKLLRENPYNVRSAAHCYPWKGSIERDSAQNLDFLGDGVRLNDAAFEFFFKPKGHDSLRGSRSRSSSGSSSRSRPQVAVTAPVPAKRKRPVPVPRRSKMQVKVEALREELKEDIVQEIQESIDEETYQRIVGDEVLEVEIARVDEDVGRQGDELEEMRQRQRREIDEMLSSHQKATAEQAANAEVLEGKTDMLELLVNRHTKDLDDIRKQQANELKNFATKQEVADLLGQIEEERLHSAAGLRKMQTLHKRDVDTLREEVASRNEEMKKLNEANVAKLREAQGKAASRAEEIKGKEEDHARQIEELLEKHRNESTELEVTIIQQHAGDDNFEVIVDQELDKQRGVHEREVNEMKETHNGEIRSLRDDLYKAQKAITFLKATQAKETKKLQSEIAALQSQITTVSERSASENQKLAQAMAENGREQMDLIAELEMKVQEASRKAAMRDDELRKMMYNQKDEVQRLHDSHRKVLAQLEAGGKKDETELTKQQISQAQEILRMKTLHNSEVTKLQDEVFKALDIARLAIAELEENHKADILGLSAEQHRKMQEVKEEYTRKFTEMDKTQTHMKTEAALDRENLLAQAETIEKMRADLEEVKRRRRSSEERKEKESKMILARIQEFDLQRRKSEKKMQSYERDLDDLRVTVDTLMGNQQSGFELLWKHQDQTAEAVEGLRKDQKSVAARMKEMMDQTKQEMNRQHGMASQVLNVEAEHLRKLRNLLERLPNADEEVVKEEKARLDKQLEDLTRSLRDAEMVKQIVPEIKRDVKLCLAKPTACKQPAEDDDPAKEKIRKSEHYKKIRAAMVAELAGKTTTKSSKSQQSGKLPGLRSSGSRKRSQSSGGSDEFRYLQGHERPNLKRWNSMPVGGKPKSRIIQRRRSTGSPGTDAYWDAIRQAWLSKKAQGNHGQAKLTGILRKSRSKSLKRPRNHVSFKKTKGIANGEGSAGGKKKYLRKR